MKRNRNLWGSVRTRQCAAWTAIAVLATAPVTAQVTTDPALESLLQMRQDTRLQSRASAEPLGVGVDGPVNPDEYFVGPGDVLGVNIWSTSPQEYQVTVTPEGFVLVPTIGIVDVKGQTLAVTRAKILQLIARKYTNASSTVALIVPRKVVVEVTGQVMNEGAFELRSVQRVSQLIELANTLPSTQVTREYYDVYRQNLRRFASQRFISVLHRDGSTERVDLVRYALSGEGRWNPFLREGDRVYVPLRNQEDNRIGVYGGVLREISFEYAEGDSLRDLVRTGLGWKDRARPELAYLARLDPQSKNLDSIAVNLLTFVERGPSDIPLQPGDRLVLPEERDDRGSDAVRVEGEVLRPGTYPITRNSTRLSEIVRAAGGFTTEANIGGATLVRSRPRRTDLPAEIEQERLLSLRTSLPAEDSTYYLTETALRLKGEVVSLDFSRLFLERDSTQDVTLRNFDRIIVPTRSRTVYVFGQVLSPGHVLFREGKPVSHYIEVAGGFTNDAREGDMRVIKGNTRAWLGPDETLIEDGDYIWVPKDNPRPFGEYLATVAQLATVVASLATVILVIDAL